ncbi:MAG: hypothetical protein ACRD3E_11565 [Terriglobales bacterium]
MSTFTRAPLAILLTDERGYPIETLNVNPAEAGAEFLAPAQVAVSSTTQTQLVGVRATRRAVMVVNTDASSRVYVGSATVTTATGHPIAPGASLTLAFVGALYAIADSGAPFVAVSEIYD